MKTFSAAYQAHLQREFTTLALCWRVEKRNGGLISGTAHDCDLVIESGDRAGTYGSDVGIMGSGYSHTDDLSVSNMEVEGAVAEDGQLDVSVEDIESGNLDHATVEVFIVNWQDPGEFQEIVGRGYLGEITRSNLGDYSTEIRTLVQLLSQVFVQTMSTRCQVREFGDVQCGFNLTAVTAPATVTAVTSLKQITLDIDYPSPTPEPGYYQGGKLVGLTGANAGFTREVKFDDVGDVQGVIALWDELPAEAEVGDTFSISPGCNRLYSTCKDMHDNLINFRGWAIFAPGVGELVKGPN